MHTLALCALTLLLMSCDSGPNQRLRAEILAGAEAWAKKNKLQDPVVHCVSDSGSCSVSWSSTEGRRVSRLSCMFVNGPGSVECYVP